MHHDAPYFIILLRLMPEDFTHQRRSAVTQWLTWHNGILTCDCAQGTLEDALVGIDAINLSSSNGGMTPGPYCLNPLPTSSLWSFVRNPSSNIHLSTSVNTDHLPISSSFNLIEQSRYSYPSPSLRSTPAHALPKKLWILQCLELFKRIEILP